MNTLDVMKQALNALSAAESFMRNGIDLGYIRMPDDDCPDPAKEAPSVVGAAITNLRAAIEQMEKQEPVAVRWRPNGQWGWSYATKELVRDLDGFETENLFTHPAPAVPTGWKLVPVKPTPLMVKRGVNATCGKCVNEVYETMLAAAPDEDERFMYDANGSAM